MHQMSTFSAMLLGGLAAVGVAAIVMVSTKKGRNIIENFGSCAASCIDTAGSAATQIASEMKDCFCGK